MWKRIGVVAAWIAATVATSAITLAAVGQAGGEVSDRPAMPVSAQELAARVAPVSTSSSAAVSTTLGAATTTSGATSTTTTLATPPTTSGSTGTSAPAGPVTESRTTPGGTVTVTLDGSVLSLASAIPAQGFDADIDSEGPSEIEVKFEKHDESVDYIIRASVDDGEITWEIHTETEGD
jgi:hypothetical protein